MFKIGNYNRLEVIKEVDFGCYLYGDESEPEILLPRKFVPAGTQLGDELDVFVYYDSEDRIIATTQKPLAVVGQFVWLEAVAVTRIGAFLNWGLEKDLFVPFREQKQKMRAGNRYLVYVYFDDESRRLAASSKVDRWLEKSTPKYKPGDEVDLLVMRRSELGVSCLVDGRFTGFIFKEDLFTRLENGPHYTGYIKKVREDGKIDLVLQQPGYQKIDPMAQVILKELLNRGGYLPLGDHSSPQEISEMFGVSKKTFKKAVGALYRRGAVSIEPRGLRLTEEKTQNS